MSVYQFISDVDWSKDEFFAKMILEKTKNLFTLFQLVDTMLEFSQQFAKEDLHDICNSCSGDKAPFPVFCRLLFEDEKAFDYLLLKIDDAMENWYIVSELLYCLEDNLEKYEKSTIKFILNPVLGPFWSIMNYQCVNDLIYVRVFKIYKRKWQNKPRHAHAGIENYCTWKVKCARLLDEVKDTESVFRAVLLAEFK